MRRRTWVRAGGGGYLDGAPGSRPVGLRTGAVRLRCATGICMSALALLALSGCQRAATGGGPGVEPPPSDDHGDDRAAATVIAPADTPLRARLETAGDVDYFKVAVSAGSVRIMAAVAAAAGPAPVVTIEDLREDSSNARAVAWSDLPSPRPRHVYLSVTGDRPASYRLAVWLVTPNEPRVGDELNLELRYLGTQPSAAQKVALEAAARFWEGAITRGLPDLPIPTSDWKCAADDPDLFGEYVDDLLIYVRLGAVEGPDVVAESSICARRARADGGLPFIGSITFDATELAKLEQHRFLERAAMRQIAYVLGFGLLWDEVPFELLKEASVAAGGAVAAGRDSHFAGEEAVRAFDESGGAAYDGAKVPVENGTMKYGSGALDLHWRESVFGTELMTTALESATAPVSKVTLASLADLGYEVDYGRAELYRLPASGAGADPAAAAGGVRFVGGGRRRAAIAVAELPAGMMRSVNGQ